MAWAPRILNSAHIYLYGGGFYSFFNNYEDSCAKKGKVCQDRLIDLSHSEEIWIYNIYTVGAKEVISPQGRFYESLDRTKFINGFATSLMAWLHLAGPDKKFIGGKRRRRGSKERSPGGPSAWCTNSGVFNKTQKCPIPRQDSSATGPDREPLKFDENPVELFEASGARDEWCDIMEILRDVQPRDSGYFGSQSMTPSRAVAQMFGYTSQNVFDCHVSSGSGCQGAIPCPEGHVEYEYQRLILQSFVVLNQVSELLVYLKMASNSNSSSVSGWTPFTLLLTESSFTDSRT
jgi:hypothetical protein